MPSPENLPVNFMISAQAKLAIDKLRADIDAMQPNDPADVLCIGWGIFMPETGTRFENVVVSFYPQSMVADVAGGIQEVSGVKFIFFTTEEYHGNFEGKVLDFTSARDFFLRTP